MFLPLTKVVFFSMYIYIYEAGSVKSFLHFKLWVVILSLQISPNQWHHRDQRVIYGLVWVWPKRAIAWCGGWFLVRGNDVKHSLRSNPGPTNSGPRKTMASVFWRDSERRNDNSQFKNNQSNSLIGLVSIQNIHFRTFFPEKYRKLIRKVPKHFMYEPYTKK